MRGILLAPVFLIILSVTVSALTLGEALGLAEGNNPQVKQARARFEAAKARTQQKSWLDQPSLVYNFRQIPIGARNPGNATWYQYGVSQKIPLPHKFWLLRSSSLNTENKYKHIYDQTYWNIRSKVISAYFKLSFAIKKREINQENLAVLKRLMKVTEAKYVVGKSSQSDLLSAQIKYELLKNIDLTFGQEIKLSRTGLQKLLNKDQKYNPETAPLPFSAELNSDLLIKRAKDSNPTLLALKSEKKSLEDMHLISKTDLIGDLKTSFFQRETPGVGLTGWDFLLSAEIPLWFWSKSSQIGEVGYKQDVVEQSYIDYNNELNQKVEAAFIKLDMAARTEGLYRKSILKKTRQALSAAEIAYKANKIDFPNLLNTQKMYFNTKLAHYRNLVDMQIYKAELESLLGRKL
ncbi:MAG: TolC family protein [Candidatus Saganbacteria bacterium]|nr:TolC family protein [Candidatus Saganbacteria bacterium]